MPFTKFESIVDQDMIDKFKNLYALTGELKEEFWFLYKVYKEFHKSWRVTREGVLPIAQVVQGTEQSTEFDTNRNDILDIGAITVVFSNFDTT